MRWTNKEFYSANSQRNIWLHITPTVQTQFKYTPLLKHISFQITECPHNPPIFAVSHCIQVIPLCCQEAHQKDHCQLTWGETLLCRRSFQPFSCCSWMNGEMLWKHLSKIRLYRQHLPQDKYDFSSKRCDVRLVFSSGEEESAFVSVYESEQPSVMLTCCWSFPAPFVGGKLWRCRWKQLIAKALKKTRKGAWQGAAEPHLFPIL